MKFDDGCLQGRRGINRYCARGLLGQIVEPPGAATSTARGLALHDRSG